MKLSTRSRLLEGLGIATGSRQVNKFMYNGVICAFKSVLVVAQTRERDKFLSVYKRFYRVGNILNLVK